jgi:hypothetical protein
MGQMGMHYYPDHRLPLKDYVFISMAHCFKIEEEKVKEIIQFLMNEDGLFHGGFAFGYLWEEKSTT